MTRDDMQLEARQRRVAVTRVGGTSDAPDDLVAVEEPLEIRLGQEIDGRTEHQAVSITMRTPGDDRELAAGFLFTEGILQHREQVREIRHCGHGVGLTNTLRVDLRPGVRDVVPANMRYVEGSAVPAAAWDAGTRTLTWTVDRPAGQTVRLTYSVVPEEAGTWPTNVEADVTWRDVRGGGGTLRFPVPHVEVVASRRIFLPYATRQKCATWTRPIDLVLLQDDKQTQPADNIAPLVRNDFLAKTDKAAFQKLLDDVSAKMDTATLTDLGKQISVDKKDVPAVAKAWLQSKGVVK